MPANSAEYMRSYRSLRKKREDLTQELIDDMLLKIMEEIESLRKEIESLRKDLLTSPIKKILTSSESKSPKVDRERAEARLDRLRVWQPSKEEEEKAFNKGLDQAYVSRQAELYRCRQENATGNAKHTNFDAGFRAWMIRAPTFEREVQQPKPNGSASAAYGPLRDPTELWAEIQAREQKTGPNAR
jgi:hypothetical protein